METQDLDIVYVLKETQVNEELRYSLRSLKNLPHARVWCFGGCPNWVNQEEVGIVKTIQDKGNKWDNTAWNFLAICQYEEVSENFVLFNDDFFVMKKVNTLPYFYDRTLASRRNDFFKIMPVYRYATNGYTKRLLNAEQALLRNGYPTKNYELHLPMIFNKQKLQSIIENYHNIGAKRSLYGNIYGQDAEQTEDVKIFRVNDEPDKKLAFLSTSDRAFADGKVGEYIRNKFKTKSKYEKE